MRTKNIFTERMVRLESDWKRWKMITCLHRAFINLALNKSYVTHLLRSVQFPNRINCRRFVWCFNETFCSVPKNRRSEHWVRPSMRARRTKAADNISRVWRGAAFQIGDRDCGKLFNFRRSIWFNSRRYWSAFKRAGVPIVSGTLNGVTPATVSVAGWFRLFKFHLRYSVLRCPRILYVKHYTRSLTFFQINRIPSIPVERRIDRYSKTYFTLVIPHTAPGPHL